MGPVKEFGYLGLVQSWPSSTRALVYGRGSPVITLTLVFDAVKGGIFVIYP